MDSTRGHAQLTYSAAAMTNRRMIGTRGRQMLRNPLLDGWLSDSVLLLRQGGVGPISGEANRYRVAIYYVVSTIRADAGAFEKAVTDAVCTAFFGIRRDSTSRPIYQDEYASPCAFEKVRVHKRSDERLDVWAAALPIEGEDDFNRLVLADTMMEVLGLPACWRTARLWADEISPAATGRQKGRTR